MSDAEMIAMLEETFDVDEGSLALDTQLEGLDCWDSVTRLSLIVMMDDEFGKELKGETVRAFETVGDILAFMRS